jgi:hypothetical protein
MVALRARVRRCRRSGGAAQKAPVVDVDHVLGPLAGGKASVFLETRQPVFGVAGADDEESPIFLTHGEPVAHREIRVHQL